MLEDRPIMRRGAPYVAEFLGTFALCFIGAGVICVDRLVGQPGLLGIALAHGLVLSVAVTATMNVSGGHLNPAVTLAMLAVKRIKGKPALGYLFSQLLGATVAGGLLLMIFGALILGSGESVALAAKLGTPFFDVNLLDPMQALLIEAVLTGLLLFAIFGTAVDARAPKVGGFGIGLAIAFDILMGGPLTGAAMNPARAFGPLVAVSLLGEESICALWAQHWVYWFGPIVGGLVGALIYDRLIINKRRGGST